jgi:bacteriorhodopsin
MDHKIRSILNIAVVVLVVLWLLFSVLGLGGGNLGAVRIG